MQLHLDLPIFPDFVHQSREHKIVTILLGGFRPGIFLRRPLQSDSFEDNGRFPIRSFTLQLPHQLVAFPSWTRLAA